jgi:hypothetical protein
MRSFLPSSIIGKEIPSSEEQGIYFLLPERKKDRLPLVSFPCGLDS